MPQPYPVLQLEASSNSHTYVLRVAGELDWFGCPALENALIEAEQSQADCIVLDLEDLDFIESKGLALLWKAACASAKDGKRLQVTPGKGQVARMFNLLGFDLTLPFTRELPGESREPQKTTLGRVPDTV